MARAIPKNIGVDGPSTSRSLSPRSSSSSSLPPMRSLWRRKVDSFYLFFFVVQIPIILFVDLVPLYPVALQAQFMLDTRQWYAKNYKDPFFTQEPPPTFFMVFTVLEGLHHLPLSLWAVGALMRDDPVVPIQLLLWAVHTTVTTLTCLAEMISVEELLNQEKLVLTRFYMPYLLVALFMGIDMFLRLKRIVKGNGPKVKDG